MERIRRPSLPSYIVGIGGSAGALNGYMDLLDALPPHTGMAFVIVSHLAPASHTQLAQILSRHTKMPVTVAAQAMLIRADHVYVCPPNADLLVEGHTFKVVSPRSKRNVQIDFFLTSLAAALGPQAIGIILSGYDGDGAEGCRQIKAKGGKTFAQDTSADIPDMPIHARDSGCIDLVLPIYGISEQLQRLARPSKRKAA